MTQQSGRGVDGIRERDRKIAEGMVGQKVEKATHF